MEAEDIGKSFSKFLETEIGQRLSEILSPIIDMKDRDSKSEIKELRQVFDLNSQLIDFEDK